MLSSDVSQSLKSYEHFSDLGVRSLSVTTMLNFSGKANTSIHGLGEDDTARLDPCCFSPSHPAMWDCLSWRGDPGSGATQSQLQSPAQLHQAKWGVQQHGRPGAKSPTKHSLYLNRLLESHQAFTVFESLILFDANLLTGFRLTLTTLKWFCIGLNHVFFQFEIIFLYKCLIVISFCFIWIPMLWFYDQYKCLNSFSAGTVFIRQNLTSTDVRFWRIKRVPALKGINERHICHAIDANVAHTFHKSTTVDLVIFACLNFREFLILWLFTKFIIPKFAFFCSSVIIIIIFVRFLNSRICLPHKSRENQDLANITRSTVLSDEPQTISQLTAEKSFYFWIETNTVTQVLFCRAIVFLEYTWMMANEKQGQWQE